VLVIRPGAALLRERRQPPQDDVGWTAGIGEIHDHQHGGGFGLHPPIDFHIGIGLNDNAPAYIFGIGYSFRLDSLF
jgi:hypothetical protein